MNKTRGFALVLAFMGCLAVRPAAAQFTLTSNPGGSVALGCKVVYSVRGNGDPANASIQVDSVTWTYWETAPNVTQPFAMIGQGMFVSTNENYMGTYTVQALVKYTDKSDPNNPQALTQTLQCSMTVLPPDDFIMPNPATVEVALRASARRIVAFQLTVGGNAICSASGKVKENLTDYSLFGDIQKPKLEVGKPSLLYLSQNAILDTKAIWTGDLAGQRYFDRLAVGTVVNSYNQQFILILKDLAGVNQKIVLAKIFRVTAKKVDNSTVAFTMQ